MDVSGALLLRDPARAAVELAFHLHEVDKLSGFHPQPFLDCQVFSQVLHLVLFAYFNCFGIHVLFRTFSSPLLGRGKFVGLLGRWQGDLALCCDPCNFFLLQISLKGIPFLFHYLHLLSSLVDFFLQTDKLILRRERILLLLLDSSLLHIHFLSHKCIPISRRLQFLLKLDQGA